MIKLAGQPFFLRVCFKWVSLFLGLLSQSNALRSLKEAAHRWSSFHLSGTVEVVLLQVSVGTCMRWRLQLH